MKNTIKRIIIFDLILLSSMMFFGIYMAANRCNNIDTFIPSIILLFSLILLHIFFAKNFLTISFKKSLIFGTGIFIATVVLFYVSIFLMEKFLKFPLFNLIGAIVVNNFAWIKLYNKTQIIKKQ